MGNFQKFIRKVVYKTLGNQRPVVQQQIKPTQNPNSIIKEEFIKKNQWIKKFDFNLILDIGANEGQAATRFRYLFPETQIVSFEPLAEPYAILNKNFANDKDFRSYNFALGNQKGTETIYLNEYTPSSSILKMGDEHKNHFKHTINSKEEKIEIEKLDNIDIIKERDIVLVKIDVQGFEKYVLLGGEQTIKKCKILIVELSFKKLYEDEPLFDDVYQILNSFGFIYHGSFDQLVAPSDGEILQQDAIFINKNL